MKKYLLLIPAILLMAACSNNETKTSEANMEHQKQQAKEQTGWAPLGPRVAEKKSELHQARKSVENAQEKIRSAQGAVTCRYNKDVRVIENRKADGGGCEVHYTKFGEEKTVANAVNDASYCDKVVDRMKGNLSSAGFTCE